MSESRAQPKPREPTHTQHNTKPPPLFNLHPPQISLPLPASLSVSPLPSSSVHEDQEAASRPASRPRLPGAVRSAPRATAVAGRVGGSPGPPRRAGQERGGGGGGGGLGLALAPERRRRGSRGPALLAGEVSGIAAIAAQGTHAGGGGFVFP
jgi:hypothetical protein